ncbi:amino acid ABC transporter permease [Cupriavidus necator]|uniref:amino acid ABC transporter permease n=1 Tax=Cupriavidus necator TaxID=106590 RepID=UPI0039C2400D
MGLDWHFFLDDPGGTYSSYLEWLLSAWGWTITVAISGLVIALAAGTAIGILRTLPSQPILRKLGNGWVELFRNIPLLVQIFLWYYVVPALVPAAKQLPGVVLAVFALALFTSARVAEQVKSGIQAQPRGQRLAAMALGMNTLDVYRYVLMPAAFRVIIPPLTSETMNIVKNSSVAFAVSVPELTSFAMQAQEETSRGVEIYLAVTALYVISALAINGLMGQIERRIRIPGRSAAILQGRGA